MMNRDLIRCIQSSSERSSPCKFKSIVQQFDLRLSVQRHALGSAGITCSQCRSVRYVADCLTVTAIGRALPGTGRVRNMLIKPWQTWLPSSAIGTFTPNWACSHYQPDLCPNCSLGCAPARCCSRSSRVLTYLTWMLNETGPAFSVAGVIGGLEPTFGSINRV